MGIACSAAADELSKWGVTVLSIIVSWRDRIELSAALPSLLAVCDQLEGDLTVVNFGGSPELLSAQLGSLSSRVRIATVSAQRYFNKASAQNLGAANSDQTLLFFCDCDVVINPAQLSELARTVSASPGKFATLAGVTESQVNARKGNHIVSFGYELRISTRDRRRLTIIDSEEDAETGARNAPGLLMVRREDFLAVNGYNAELHGWGWEDQDMIARLTLGRGLERISSGYAVHLSHDDNARIAAYPPVQSRWESRDRMFRAALENYDRNNFLGTYIKDIKTNHVVAG